MCPRPPLPDPSPAPSPATPAPECPTADRLALALARVVDMFVSPHGHIGVALTRYAMEKRASAAFGEFDDALVARVTEIINGKEQSPDYDLDKDKVKELAYKLDPECWESYSGKPVQYKRAVERRRVAALAAARKQLGQR